MSAVNDGVRRAAREEGCFGGNASLIDDLTSSVAAAQAGATPLTGALHRITSGAATASFILKPLAERGTPKIVRVINDGPNSINVYPFVGDTMNGSANAALAVAAGATGFFVNTSVFVSAGTLTQDWRAGAIT